MASEFVNQSMFRLGKYSWSYTVYIRTHSYIAPISGCRGFSSLGFTELYTQHSQGTCRIILASEFPEILTLNTIKIQICKIHFPMTKEHVGLRFVALILSEQIIKWLQQLKQMNRGFKLLWKSCYIVGLDFNGLQALNRPCIKLWN